MDLDSVSPIAPPEQSNKNYVRPTIRDSVFLLQAFDMLGERLYGETWDGEEFRQGKIEEHEEERKRLPIARKEADDLRSEFLDIQSRKAASSRAKEIEEYATRLDTLRPLLAERQAEVEKLETSYGSSFLAQRECWHRRCDVLDALMNALTHGELLALTPYSQIEPWVWESRRDLNVILPLSYAKSLSNRFGSKRTVILLPRKEFERWLRKKTLKRPEIWLRLTKDERMKMVGENALFDTTPALTRPKFVQKLQKECGAGAREAEKLWDDLAPQEARKPGRKKKAEK